MSLKGIDLTSRRMTFSTVIAYAANNMLDFAAATERDHRAIEAAMCFAPIHVLLRERAADGSYSALGAGANSLAALLAFHADQLRLPADSRYEPAANKLFSELPPMLQNRIEDACIDGLVIGVKTPDSAVADAVAVLKGAGFH